LIKKYEKMYDSLSAEREEFTKLFGQNDNLSGNRQNKLHKLAGLFTWYICYL